MTRHYDYDRQLGSAMTLQAEVAKEVASSAGRSSPRRAARRKLSREIPRRTTCTSRDASPCSHFTSFRPLNSFGQRKRRFAIQRDPGFGLAYCGAVSDVRLLIFCFNDNIDTGAAGDAVISDAVRRLMPNTAALTAGRLMGVRQPRLSSRAFALLSAAETAGYADLRKRSAREPM